MLPDTSPRLSTQQIQVGYGNKSVLSDINLEIPSGKITALVGANGCGKSTLLKTIARVLDPEHGQVLLGDVPVAEIRRKKLAQQVALLPQTPQAPEGFNVRDLVSFGRHPHRSSSFKTSRHEAEEDERLINLALEQSGMVELQKRPLDQLSGGQRQRAWIAMALAQNTPILMLDEPTTYLDIAHQTEVLKLLRDLNRQHDRTIVMVLHDLNQAARYADHIIAVADGGVAAVGEPSKILNEELIEQVFGLRCAVVSNPLDGTPWCLPLD